MTDPVVDRIVEKLYPTLCDHDLSPDTCLLCQNAELQKALGNALHQWGDEVARLKECTHCHNPGCPNYNGPIGWDKREQYS